MNLHGPSSGLRHRAPGNDSRWPGRGSSGGRAAQAAQPAEFRATAHL